MIEQEQITLNPDQRTDTLDRVLRYAVQKGGVKSNQIESAETRWGALVERFNQMQAASRAADPESVPALIDAEFKKGSTRHDVNVVSMTALALDIDKDADLDPELIPAPFRGWIADTAYRMQCSIDFCALAAVVILAAVVGAAIGIRPKRKDDWSIVPNLWGGVIGPPSKKKTPALAEMVKALGRLEKLAANGTL